jgi:hypothetical protein
MGPTYSITDAPAPASGGRTAAATVPGPSTDPGAPTVPDTIRQDMVGGSIGEGDITSTASFRGEIANAEGVLEEFADLTRRIVTWTGQLPDRYNAAPFGTDRLTAAVNRVGDANGDADQIRDGLVEMLDALDEADGLGETVTGLQAHGRVDAFRSAG